MPDTKISALTDGTTANSTDRIPVARDAGGGTFNNRYVTPGYIGTTLLGSGTALTGSTVTTSSPVLNLTQTWNDGAGGTVTFTGLKFNATDTASAAASLLLDLQVGGSSKFSVDKNGVTTTANRFQASEFAFGNNNKFVYQANTAINAFAYGQYVGSFCSIDQPKGFQFSSDSLLQWANTTSANAQGSSNVDLYLRRAASATLQLGAADAAAPVAQFFKVQSGTAGASATTVSISGTSLTIAGTVTGTIAIGHAVTGTGVSAGTLITAGSGTSWTVNNSQTVGPITAYFNSVGADFTIRGSQGSGPSAGGSLIFQVAPAGSAATTAQNAYSTALTIASDKSVTIPNGSVINLSYTSVAANGNWSFSAGSLTQVGGISMSGGGNITLSGTSSLNWSDVYLTRDTTNTLALRNGGTSGTPVPQTFRVYNWGDASNGEYIETFFTSNVAYVRPNKNGTGAVRDFQLGSTSSSTTIYGGNSSSYLSISVNGCTLSSVASLSLNADYGNNKLTLSSAGVTVTDAVNIIVGTTTGTKIGTATSQKIGFWNATPAVQPTAVADATNATDVITQLNALLSRMRTIGVIAT